MTYRELHTALAAELDRSVDYLTLKAAVARHMGTNPLAIAGSIRELGQLGALRCGDSGEWWTVLPVK